VPGAIKTGILAMPVRIASGSSGQAGRSLTRAWHPGHELRTRQNRLWTMFALLPVSSLFADWLRGGNAHQANATEPGQAIPVPLEGFLAVLSPQQV
jgi:hypothetical protein